MIINHSANLSKLSFPLIYSIAFLYRDVVECMHEARMWQSLGFEPPTHMTELCNREKNIIELRENMLTICRTYNETIASMFIFISYLKLSLQVRTLLINNYLTQELLMLKNVYLKT